jgi:hypothetical protein
MLVGFSKTELENSLNPLKKARIQRQTKGYGKA